MRVVGIILIVLALPVLIGLLRAKPQYRKWAYFGIGVLPFTMSALNLDAAFVSWAGWTGYSHGIIVSFLDVLALAIIATSQKHKIATPFVALFGLYFFATFISMFSSSLWMSSAFYIFQLIRVFIVFFAVASFSGDYSQLRWLALGLAIGATYQCAMTIEQRLSGVVQASGTMGHQNLLGLMLHFVSIPLVALILAGERSKIIAVGTMAALLAVALGASRGSLAFVVVGLFTVICLSLVRRLTSHKFKIIGIGLLAVSAVVPLALITMSDRFNGGAIDFTVDAEREAFERAARSMWSDNPMGVGANQYVVVANTEGYSERAGVIWNWGSRSAKVHNMYLLAGAETGWLGLFSLLALLFIPIVLGLRFSLRYRTDPHGDIIIGSTASLIALAFHGLYEWVFFMVDGQYMFAIALGIIAGNLRSARRDRLQRIRSAVQPGVPGLLKGRSSAQSGASRAVRVLRS